MAVNDGGPAFAMPSHGMRYQNESQDGMSLRAYLAAKAMQGLLARADIDIATTGPAGISQASVKFSDALIAELAKGKL